MKKTSMLKTTALGLCLLFFLVSCTFFDTKKEQPAKKAEPVTISLAAVGDNLIHNTIYMAAKTSDGYDFTPIYAPVRPLIQSADIAFVNQETPLASDIYPVSNYPLFNTPQKAGQDLVTIGFDVINQASNHAMDKGTDGVLSTINFWKKQSGAVMIGLFESQQDRDTPRIIERKGIKIGFLSYTYGTNGLGVPHDKPYLISIIDRELIKSDIERLKGKCDLIAVSMHWGSEYSLGVTKEQRELAGFLTQQGAGLIIGHHPHVIEPAEWITAPNQNRAFCVYSLGNFISSQDKRISMLGGMLTATIKKDDSGTSVQSVKIIPIVTHYEKGWRNYRVYPLYDYTDELARRHFVNDYDDSISLSYLWDTAKQVYGSYLDEGK